MEGTMQGTSDRDKEQVMLKLMSGFIVLTFASIGACVLLGGLTFGFFRLSSSGPDVAAASRPVVVEPSGSGPADAAPEVAVQPRLIPVREETPIAALMLPLVLLGAVAIICAFGYNMFRMYLQ